jgi:hypothetical protein
MVKSVPPEGGAEVDGLNGDTDCVAVPPPKLNPPAVVAGRAVFPAAAGEEG